MAETAGGTTWYAISSFKARAESIFIVTPADGVRGAIHVLIELFKCTTLSAPLRRNGKTDGRAFAEMRTRGRDRLCPIPSLDEFIPPPPPSHPVEALPPPARPVPRRSASLSGRRCRAGGSRPNGSRLPFFRRRAAQEFSPASARGPCS